MEPVTTTRAPRRELREAADALASLSERIPEELTWSDIDLLVPAIVEADRAVATVARGLRGAQLRMPAPGAGQGPGLSGATTSDDPEQLRWAADA